MSTDLSDRSDLRCSPSRSRLQFKEELVVDADGLIQEEEASTSAGSARLLDGFRTLAG